MSESVSPNARAITFLETTEFLHHDVSAGRMDRMLSGDVTVSAIPNTSGVTQFEARKADGTAVPVFKLTIQPVLAAGPVTVDATEGVYVCYEDESRLQSWCVQVKKH